MVQPGVSGSQIPAGEDFAQRQIKDLQRDIRELRPSVARSFKPVVDDLAAQQAALAAQQATLTTNVADIAANVTAINDLLTRVVSPATIYGSATNFALTTTLTTLKTITLTVPTGYTTAQITATGSVYAINPNTTGGSNGAGGDYLIAETHIGAYWGYGLPLTTVGLGSSNVNRAPFVVTLTGLTAGGTIDVAVKGGTSFLTWAANTLNTVELTGSVLWLR
jgi:hypothetical protein